MKCASFTDVFLCFLFSLVQDSLRTVAKLICSSLEGPQCIIQPLQDQQEEAGTSGRKWNNSTLDEFYHFRFTTQTICIASAM